MVVLPHEVRVLVVDDDVAFRELLAQVLSDAGYAVTTCGGGASAACFLSEEGSMFEDVSLVLVDQCMPAITGLELTRWLHTSGGPPVVLMSAFADIELVEAAGRAGAITVLPKPFRLSHLMEVVRANAPLARKSA